MFITVDIIIYMKLRPAVYGYKKEIHYLVKMVGSMDCNA
jgi:hypothetical protein